MRFRQAMKLALLLGLALATVDARLFLQRQKRQTDAEKSSVAAAPDFSSFNANQPLGDKVILMCEFLN
jgi:hypothetical protein